MFSNFLEIKQNILYFTKPKINYIVNAVYSWSVDTVYESCWVSRLPYSLCQLKLRMKWQLKQNKLATCKCNRLRTPMCNIKQILARTINQTAGWFSGQYCFQVFQDWCLVSTSRKCIVFLHLCIQFLFIVR